MISVESGQGSGMGEYMMLEEVLKCIPLGERQQARGLRPAGSSAACAVTRSSPKVHASSSHQR